MTLRLVSSYRFHSSKKVKYLVYFWLFVFMFWIFLWNLNWLKCLVVIDSIWKILFLLLFVLFVWRWFLWIENGVCLEWKCDLFIIWY
jgi:hypothetical protein